MIHYMDYLNLPTVVIVIIVAILVVSNIINPTKNVIALIKNIYHSIINHFNQDKVFQEVIKTNQEAIKELSKKQDEDRAASKQGDKELKEELNALKQEMSALKESQHDCKNIILSVRIENMRKTILDFASSVGNGRSYTKEQYNFVIKTYHDYEKLIEDYELTNDEVNISFKIIMEKFEECMRNSTFLDSHYKRNEDDIDD